MANSCRKAARPVREISCCLNKAVIKTIIFLLTGYRYLVSPILGRCCRFYPSCSQYAQEALAKHGILRGGWLAIKRLLSCHPLHAGGYDPVPDGFSDRINLKTKRHYEK